MRRLLRWLTPVVLAGLYDLPVALAQVTAAGAEKQERPPPAPQYAVAILAILLILTIVCYPSRKQ